MKKTNHRAIFFAAGILLFVMFCSACGQKKIDQLIGVWHPDEEDNKSGFILIFFDDTHFSWHYDTFHNMTGTYEREGDNKVVLSTFVETAEGEIDPAFPVCKYYFTIQGDRLIYDAVASDERTGDNDPVPYRIHDKTEYYLGPEEIHPPAID